MIAATCLSVATCNTPLQLVLQSPLRDKLQKEMHRVTAPLIVCHSSIYQYLITVGASHVDFWDMDEIDNVPHTGLP